MIDAQSGSAKTAVPFVIWVKSQDSIPGKAREIAMQSFWLFDTLSANGKTRNGRIESYPRYN